ncbi:hypothetical protein AB4K05_09695 [Kluyvera sp. STS39-E]|uniref:hypothetical protein n=1 Tax=Kluyvera sp. STS39-E TaxID=3234748 RepID=UPI0034C5E84A
MKNKISIFGTSKKKSEKRIPLHPSMFNRLDEDLKRSIFFEEDYGKELGITNDSLQNDFGGILPREELFSKGDVWVLPKPDDEDYRYFSPGKILWGWSHCVQGNNITQAAINNKMTIVAWEAMYGGNDNCHIFYRNNELAGYAAIQHMMMLVGRNGYFGNKLKAAVLGFGASARGAISSLKSLGIDDVTVYSKRPSYLISAPIQNIDYQNLKIIDGECYLSKDNAYLESAIVLSTYDVIVNCVLQDPINPLVFMNQNDLSNINKQLDIVDISCDKGMGFEFAVPTTFESPLIKPTSFVNYYSVDHTPNLYWNSASYEISKSVIDFIALFSTNDWLKNDTLKNATEILMGDILNKKILTFQSRQSSYPYHYNAKM